MAKLGDLYFDVILKDNTDTQIQKIKEKLERDMKLNLDVKKAELRGKVKDALSEEFKIKIVLDKASTTRALRDALQQAAVSQTLGIDSAQARALREQYKHEERLLVAQAKARKINEAAARAAASATRSLSSARRSSIAATRAANRAERARAMAMRATRSAAMANIPILGDLMNMARNYIGVFGAVSAVRSLYRIRGEFERQQVALKALMQSASQARDAFGELQSLALKSPYKVSEIISFSKQLSAFSIPNRELVDTTKRLADVAAGLGVDMGRIILAYGQVRAATVLRGQELRQFTEAGIPMVEMLADQLTKAEGKVVTAAEIFERISKKQISFENVKQVFTEMTDEGGRFYNHQEKMVETLYGKVNRMGDAWNVMMNKIGESNDALLKWPIDKITQAMMNWRSTMAFIVSAFTAIGANKLGNVFYRLGKDYRASQNIWSTQSFREYQRLTTSGINTKFHGFGVYHGKGSTGVDKLGRELGKDISNITRDYQNLQVQGERTFQVLDSHMKAHIRTAGVLKTTFYGVGQAIKNIGRSIAGFFAANWVGFLMMAITEVIMQIHQAHSEIKAFNASIRDNASETFNEISEYVKSRRDVFDKLSDSNASFSADELDKIWVDLKSNLEKLGATDFDIAKLLNIDDLRARCQAAVDQLKELQDVMLFLKNNETDISFTQDTILWGAFGEGLASDMKDYANALKKSHEYAAKLRKEIEAISNAGRDPKSSSNVEALNALFDKANKKFARHEAEAIAEAKKTAESWVGLLDEAISSGYARTPEKMRMLVQQIIQNVEQQVPNMDAASKRLFETVVFSHLEALGYKFDSTVFASKATIAGFTTYLDSEAKKSGHSLEEVFKMIDSNVDSTRDAGIQAFKDMAQKALEDAREKGDGMYEVYEQMVNDINQLQIVIRASIQMPTLTGLQKVVNGMYSDTDGWGAIKNDARNTAINIPTSLLPTDKETDIDTWTRRVKKERDEAIAAKATAVAAKKKADAAKAAAKNDKDAANAAAQSAEAAKEIEGYDAIINGAKTIFDDWGEPKDKNKGRGSRGGGNKKDIWLENAKLRLKELRDAYSEVQKWRKYMSEDAAIDKVMESELGKQVGRNALTESGYSAALDKFINDVKAHMAKMKPEVRDAYQKVIDEASKADMDALIKAWDNLFKELQDKMRRFIDTSAKNWNLYDKLFAITGDEKKSAFAAFGGEKMFDNYIAQLEDYFKQNTGLNVADFFDDKGELKVTKEQFKDVANGADIYYDVLVKIRDMKMDKAAKFWDEYAKALEKTLTNEDKIARKEKEIADLDKKMAEQFGGNWRDNSEAVSVYETIMRALKKDLHDLLNDSIKLTKWWERLFEDTANDTLTELRNKIREYKDDIEAFKTTDGGKTYTGYITDDNGDRKETTINASEYLQILKQIKAIEKDLEEKSPTDWFKDWFKDLKGLKGGALIEHLGNAILKLTEVVKQATEPLKSFFDAIGAEGASDTISLLEDQMNALGDMAVGVGRAAQGDWLGGGLQAVGGLFSSITSFFNFHDKRLDRIIERSKRETKKLQNAYSQIEKAIERTLGSIYRAEGGNAYNEMLQNLVKQREELQKQYEAEQDKKKTDKDAIIDYEQQLWELDDTIKNFAQDMADSLYGIDLKSWAKDLTDAVVDAWASGANAADAYKNKAHEIIKSLTKNILAQKVMEAALSPVLDTLTAEMTKKGGKLDEQTIIALAQGIENAGNGAVDTITGIMDALANLGYDMRDATDGGTLGRGIQNITEDTADLLASYLNAIRADVAIIRMLEEQWMGGALAQSQLQQMQLIADNTMRNADAAERIESALNSVITTGSTGKKIRV